MKHFCLVFPPSGRYLWPIWWPDETSTLVDPRFGAHTEPGEPAAPENKPVSLNLSHSHSHSHSSITLSSTNTRIHIHSRQSAISPSGQGVKCHWPPCRSWASAAARCPAAGWPGGTSCWCWGDAPDRDESASSACGHPPGDCEKPASTEASRHRLTRPWPPSGGPCLQPWTACRRGMAGREKNISPAWILNHEVHQFIS